MVKIRETERFKAWIRAIKDEITQAIINARIRRAAVGGFRNAKPVGSGVSELRIDYGPGFRVYFTRRGNEVVLLLCGGDKSTQNRDIESAKQLAKKSEEE